VTRVDRAALFDCTLPKGMSGAGIDNALAENFFSTLKVERVYRTSYRSREEAELDLFRYIDGWYNPTASSMSLAG
jgi:transposase InsO family protein